MGYDKEKYERLIIESQLFELDKETQYTAFKREAYKMVEYLYCYLLSVNEQKYEPYGCEITEVATRCLNNYSKDKGEFLHYFNAAWKQEYQHIMGDEVQNEKLRGLRITEEDRRAVRKYIRLASAIDTGVSKESLYTTLAVTMSVSVDRIRELALIANTSVSGDSYENADGDLASLWDQIADDSPNEGDLYVRESVEEILLAIDRIYLGLQVRQRPIISDMITIKICEYISGIQCGGFSFLNQEIVEHWNKTGILPTQRDIALKYGRDETSISRSVKDFIKKLRKEVN